MHPIETLFNYTLIPRLTSYWPIPILVCIVTLFQYFQITLYFMGADTGFKNEGGSKDSHLRFLSDPELYDKKVIDSVGVDLRNPTARHLGYYNGNTATSTEEFVEWALREFQNAIILEYFEESLVFLKRRLCLPDEYITLLVRMRPQKHGRAVPQDLQNNLRNFNSIDYAIYHAFLKRFKHELYKQGTDFWDEVSALKSVSSAVSEYCMKLCPIVHDNLDTRMGDSDMEQFWWDIMHHRHRKLPLTRNGQTTWLKLSDCLILGMGPIEYEFAYRQVLHNRGSCDSRYLYCYNVSDLRTFINRRYDVIDIAYRDLRDDSFLFCPYDEQ